MPFNVLAALVGARIPNAATLTDKQLRSFPAKYLPECTLVTLHAYLYNNRYKVFIFMYLPFFEFPFVAIHQPVCKLAYFLQCVLLLSCHIPLPSGGGLCRRLCAL